MQIDAGNQDDLIVVTNNGPSNPGSIFMALSQGTSFVTTRFGSTLDTPKLLVTEDLDCDGLKDILVYSTSGTHTVTIDVYSNTGNGGFAATPQTLTLTDSILSIAVANLDGDDKPDLAVLHTTPTAAIVIYQNTSS